MERKRRVGVKATFIVAALVVVGALSAVVTAGASTARVSSTYVKRAVLTGPQIPAKPDWHFDQAMVDSAGGWLYIADPSNKRVDVISISSGKYVGGIGGFTGTLDIAHGYDQLGPAGLALDNHGQLWAGDGKGMIKVINSATRKVITVIHTGAKKQADVFALDPADGLVMVTCPGEKVPFVAFINGTTHKLVGKTQLAGAIGWPAWNATTDKFYIGVTTKKGGQVDVINPKTRKVDKTFALGKCEPTGAVFGPGTQLLVGCATGKPAIIDVATGKILARLTAPAAGGMGIDQVAYDSTAQRYFLADAPNIRVIDARTMKPLASLVNGDLGGHAVAVDTVNDEVFAPNADFGVLVFAPS